MEMLTRAARTDIGNCTTFTQKMLSHGRRNGPDILCSASRALTGQSRLLSEVVAHNVLDTAHVVLGLSTVLR